MYHFSALCCYRIYMAGPVPQVSKLYPAVHFPVSRGTPSISPLVNWEHTENWHILDDVTVVSNCCNGYHEKERRKCGKSCFIISKIKHIFLEKVKLHKFLGFHHSCCYTDGLALGFCTMLWMNVLMVWRNLLTFSSWWLLK